MVKKNIDGLTTRAKSAILIVTHGIYSFSDFNHDCNFEHHIEKIIKIDKGELLRSGVCGKVTIKEIQDWLRVRGYRLKNEKVESEDLKHDPIAYVNDHGLQALGNSELTAVVVQNHYAGKLNPLYTSPPQQKPLNDDEITEVYKTLNWGESTLEDIVRAVEKVQNNRRMNERPTDSENATTHLP